MPKAATSKATKSPAAVSADVAEATPDLLTSTKTKRSKKAVVIGGQKDDKKKKSTKRAAEEVTPVQDAPADAPPTKKTKLSKVALPTSISDVKARPSKGKKAAVVEVEDETDNEQNQAEEETHLHGFSSGTDSSDDDDDDDGVDSAPIDVGKLPTIARDDATVKRKLEKAKRQPTVDHGVLYLGRIPHGFYEAQMKEYFTQFGDVTRLRLSRNKRTGRSKHYAFIEFDSSSVAQIVSETMDNYLLLGHILVCKVIPKDEVHAELWVGSNRKWRKVPNDRIARVAHNRTHTDEQQQKSEKRLLKRQRQKQLKLTAAGIDYDLSAVGYVARPAEVVV